MAESERPRSIKFEADPAYWQALGEFVEEFASVEAMLLLAVSLYAGLRPLVGRAILSGMRPDAAVSYIRRITEVNPLGDDARQEIEHILGRVSVLNDFRNQVVHNPSFTVDGLGRIVSNAGRAHLYARIRETRVSPTILADATADLKAIGELLSYHLFRDTLTADGRTHFGVILARAWRYKPAQQPQPQKQKRTPRQGVHRQSRSE